MRQLRDGKVENFPPQSQLRCVMVEHSLQGEDGSLSVLDFVAAGKYKAVKAPGKSLRATCLARQSFGWYTTNQDSLAVA